MEKYIEEKDVLKNVKEFIYEICSVEKNDCKNKLWINFYFYYDDAGFIKTQILADDMYNTTKSYLISDKVSIETVGDLVELFLLIFPYVNSLYTSEFGFKIGFGMGVEQRAITKINCDELEVSFDTHPDLGKDFSCLFDSYLEYIMLTFQKKIGNNSKCVMGYYKGYYDILKPKLIKSFNSIELKQIFDLLTDEEMRNLLSEMCNGRFFSLYEELKNKNNSSNEKSLKIRKKAIVESFGDK